MILTQGKNRKADIEKYPSIWKNISIDNSLSAEEKKKKYIKFYYGFSLEKYILNYGKKEGTLKYKEMMLNRSQSLEGFIFRLGKNIGTKKFREMCDKKKKFSLLDNYIKKFGTEEGTKRYKEICKSKSLSKDNFISRYGKIKGTKKYKAMCDKHKGKNTLDYYILKYGKDEGTKKYKEKNIFCSGSLNGFILRHGKESGTKKYNDFCNTISKTSKENMKILKRNHTPFSH